ncbi:NUDIX hydrolase [Desulfobacterales bacterium HSG17]|nr:NUDIX hydrolase [Desulfobacterales bacterium HSG17]
MSVIINHCNEIYSGRIFNMVRENVTLKNGVTIDIDTIHHPGASAIVPIDENNRVVMIRQYRHAMGRYIWEIPAGTLNMGEEPLECAKRELIEETGFSGHQWEKLGEITPVPGYSDERIHIFLATKIKAAVQNLDADEILDVHEILIYDAVSMIEQGKIQDSKTICGLFMALHKLEKTI